MKRDLLAQFEAYVLEHDLFQLEDRIYIAVSGGVDSMVLCDVCLKAGYDVSWVHCNFQLRGEESERDETFIRTMADRTKRTYFVKRFDTAAYAHQQGISIQEAARELRYTWFSELLQQSQEKNAGRRSVLLTAHHGDDNVETLLMHFFRGTGVAGLTGIPRVNGSIVRPLLFATREQILDYAKANSIDWVEDSSNSTVKYTRNFIRHQVIPMIEQGYPQVRQHLREQIRRFEGIETIYMDAVARFKKRWVVVTEQQWKVPVRAMQQIPSVETYLFECLKLNGFSSAQMPDIMHLLKASTGKYVVSATHQIVRHREWLVVAPLSTSASFHLISDIPATCTTKQFILKVDNWKHEVAVDATVAHLDMKNLSLPFILRPWKAGDYFYPLGMRKKKKVARFLIDQKLSKPDKEKVYVLESAGSILWVVGQRIDDRFKITPQTTQGITICLKALSIPDNI